MIERTMEDALILIAKRNSTMAPNRFDVVVVVENVTKERHDTRYNLNCKKANDQTTELPRITITIPSLVGHF